MASQRKMFTWTVKIEVAESWVADGFDLTADRAQNMVLTDLGYARSDEVVATIIKAPKASAIAKAQSSDS